MSLPRFSLRYLPFTWRYQLRLLWRIVKRDPSLRPGRHALNEAVMRWGSPLGPLIRALEAGGYDAAPTELKQGCELKLEDLEGVMANVTFSTEHIKLRKQTPAEKRETAIFLARCRW